jgi:hypothetical protein
MAGPGARIDAAVGGLCAQLQEALQSAATAAGRADAGGLVVSTDPGRVDRGGGWLSPREAVAADFAGGYEVTAWLYLVAADVDEPTARAQLSASLDAVGPLVDLVDDEPIDLAASIALPNNPTTRLPAYRLVITIDTE